MMPDISPLIQRNRTGQDDWFFTTIAVEAMTINTSNTSFNVFKKMESQVAKHKGREHCFCEGKKQESRSDLSAFSLC